MTPTTTYPQTHVLIIGVGNYPHVRDGTEYVQGVNSLLDSLGQLTSPIASANAFYKKVKELQTKNLWRYPLGSVTLLNSDAKANHRPTRKNVNDSYAQWKLKCESHPDNVAVFFFSGHGLEKYDHYLLLEDFGANSNNIWEGAFDFDSTRRAFHACSAKTQCFFVDACRLITIDMLTTRSIALPLENPSELTSDSEFSLTIKSSAHNEAAHGRTNEPSFFTKALIGAFERYGYTKKNAEWVIETNTLSSYMDDFMRLISNGTQQCICVMSRSTVIIKNSQPPDVDVTVSCDPKAAHDLAHMECENLDSGKRESRAPEPVPWNLKVSPGIYRLSAKFNGASFRDTTKHADAKPFPKLEEILVCQPR
jgi:hypothetical protein